MRFNVVFNDKMQTGERACRILGYRSLMEADESYVLQSTIKPAGTVGYNMMEPDYCHLPHGEERPVRVRRGDARGVDREACHLGGGLGREPLERGGLCHSQRHLRGARQGPRSACAGAVRARGRGLGVGGLHRAAQNVVEREGPVEHGRHRCQPPVYMAIGPCRPRPSARRAVLGHCRCRASAGRRASRTVPSSCSCMAYGPRHGPWATWPCRAPCWARPILPCRAGP